MIATTNKTTPHRPTTMRAPLHSYITTSRSVRTRGANLPRHQYHHSIGSLESIPEESSKEFSSEESTFITKTKRSTSNLRNQLELVNQDRRCHGLNPFRSSKSLNHLASLHVRSMVAEKSVFHSVNCVEELIQRLSSDRVAENIQRGDDIVEMHENTMEKHCINRSNILSTMFSEFGSAVAVGEDGKLYTCQLFRG